MADSKAKGIQDTVYETQHVEKANVHIQEHPEDEQNAHLQPMLHGEPMLLPGKSPTITFDASPRHLAEDWKWELFWDVYDSFLIIISLVLLAKTSLCIFAWKKDINAHGIYLDTVSSMTLNLIRFNEQLVTAFTIIFVTIMTTVTRRYALFKAQKGAYIADIEQLQASISLPSTIKMVFSLQRFTKVSVILVGLWSFYYTGSQASKREYELTISNKGHTLTAYYPRTDAAYLVDLDDTDSWFGGAPADFATILKRWGGDKTKQTGSDDDGNILLPDANYVQGLYMNATVRTPHSIEVKSSSSTTYLTPPVGRPLFIQVMYTGENGTVQPERYWESPRVVGDYQLRTSYSKFHCLSIDVVSAKEVPAGTNPLLPISMNITDPSASTQNGARQLQFYHKWISSETYLDTITGDFVQRPDINGSGGGAYRITCDVLEPQVYVNVHCGEASCLVKKMFYPQLDNKTLASTAFSNDTFAQSFFSSMLLSEGVPTTRLAAQRMRIVDEFLQSPGYFNDTPTDVALQYMSSRLDTLVNGYLNLMLRAGLQSVYYGDNPGAGFDKLDLEGAPWDPHYQIFWEWIAIDYVAGACLLGAAIFSFWLRKNTIAPDIFGFVSSLTRDNPHFPVPVGGSTLDGISRTRAFRNVKVKLGDIGTDAEGHGRLGFVPILASAPPATLSRYRKYI